MTLSKTGLGDRVTGWWLTLGRRPVPDAQPAIPAPPPQLPALYTEAAAMLEQLAEWDERELAAGQPPKWVAGQAAKGARFVAAWLRTEGGAR